MEDDTTRPKESVSLAAVANMGDELEEDQPLGSDLNHAEDRNNLNEASQEPLSGRRTLQAALRVRHFYREHAQLFRWICIGLLCTAFAAFLLTACILNFQRALPLFVLTCVVLAFLAYSLLKRRLGPNLRRCATPWEHSRRQSLWFKRGLALAAFLGLVLWLALDTSQRPEQLVSFAGICVFIGILFACSKHHRAIFLNYTKAGSKFVFGEALIKDVFAFQVLPIIIFFSCVMSILYHLGLMQWVILKISWLMQVTMRTTAPETLSVAGNIFVSQTEAPLLIRPYLEDMTLSEVHVVMTGGYATIAGSLLGAYISFGIDAASLIAASVMAAPCALALSKLVYPEVEESKFRNKEGVQLSSGDAQNILEAASSGAAISVNVIANIVANLIAFLAVLDFINATFSWLGNMVNIQGLSFQLICSYILRPVAFLMGVAWEDCPVVSELLGIKLFLNEFVAYEKLSKYKHRRLTGVEEWINGEKQWISIVLRALFTGACVSLMNACVAGILYVPREAEVNCTSLLNTTLTSTSFDVYQCCRKAFQSTSPEFSLDNCCRFYNNTICP
ncbi:Sodium/nucleoside cotransporter 1 [Myotis davidii]|uniref:Sodium/nucleoside cotransporter 1 n=1 Tax=Myotis davidii TaxID=225400 RepID=L5LZS0_MYODS|nr:Sodium/nucleoside cotransporter 1 [Myotis davidii]